MDKRIERIAEKHCDEINRILDMIAADPQPAAEKLSKVNDCIRVLGNLQIMQRKEETNGKD